MGPITEEAAVIARSKNADYSHFWFNGDSRICQCEVSATADPTNSQTTPRQYGFTGQTQPHR